MAKEASWNDNIKAAAGSWGRARTLFLAMAGIGLGLSAVGYFTDRNQFFHSYLTGYVFTLLLALGCLGFVLIQHLARAGWSVVIRRFAETAAVTLPVLAVLFLPVLLGLHELFHWTHHDAVEHDPILQHKEGYLNVPFFLIRAGLYFAVWALAAIYLYRKSVAQDTNPNPQFTVVMQRRAAPLMILFAFSLTFMAFDWLMSLDPHWFSTIFGVYIFAGATLSAHAFLTLVSAALHKGGYLKSTVTEEHFHDLGRFMFAFTVFWTYIAFSQFFLIWYGNLPEETLWFLHRAEGSWKWYSLLLPIGRFALPFMLLMSRYTKRMPKFLVFMAGWILVMQYVDIYWLVMPNLHKEGVHFHWLDLACLVGTLGVFLTFFTRRLAGPALVPAGDPRLKESLALKHAY